MTYQPKTLAAATTGLKFTESPRWYHDKLWFLDIHDKRIKTVDLAGTVTTAVELPFLPNAFGFTPRWHDDRGRYVSASGLPSGGNDPRAAG